MLFLPFLASNSSCEKDCLYYNTNGDGLYGEYNLNINGKEHISHPKTMETFDMDVYTLLKKDTCKVFTYKEGLGQKQKVSTRISELYNLLADPSTVK